MPLAEEREGIITTAPACQQLLMQAGHGSLGG